mmetsp:Transcript_21538/g.56939  ORF Transcript_21538/g.56939 Transcript_21538/m.56939 type:complete len:94 (+) Transcript_21538:292-573(+)
MAALTTASKSRAADGGQHSDLGPCTAMLPVTLSTARMPVFLLKRGAQCPAPNTTPWTKLSGSQEVLEVPLGLGVVGGVGVVVVAVLDKAPTAS